LNSQSLKRILPRASHAVIQLNSEPSSAESEHSAGSRSLAKAKTKNKGAGKCIVRITSYRTRLCDPDNLVGKWHLDSLRYARILHDDRPEDITYTITQKKSCTQDAGKDIDRSHHAMKYLFIGGSKDGQQLEMPDNYFSVRVAVLPSFPDLPEGYDYPIDFQYETEDYFKVRFAEQDKTHYLFVHRNVKYPMEQLIKGYVHKN
jgi:hypothetical protein